MTVDKDWWRGAVMYQIYPRSYKDSNNDGIGDLPGITDKLDHIASLGVDGIWISPFFKSPMKDYGYDVSDYCAVDPIFGSNEDFTILLQEAHKRGIKVIIDLVMSHTSSDHAWFLESRSSRENARSDWYVWADPKPDGTPPNNWQSCFSGAAWTFDTRRGQYYLHNFLSEQPDLNLHNPDVQAALLDACRFWLDMGVDGFRLDVVNFYFHDQQLRNNPPRDPDTVSTGVQFEKRYPYIMQQHVYDKSQPENIAFLQRLRALTDQYEATMMIGEIGDDDPFKLAVEYCSGGDKLHTSYSTHMMAGQDKVLVKSLIEEPITLFASHSKEAWPSWAFCNHDVVRVATRWGRDVPIDKQADFAKMLMALLCALRGSVYLYQGEELGLPEAVIPYEKIQDPWGKALWPEWQGRDGCRTPMPWNELMPHTGFSDTAGDTWLPVPDAHAKLSVSNQENDPASMLNFTRELIAWRKTKPVLIKGDMIIEEQDDESLMIFTRRLGNDVIRCRFNLSAVERDGLAPYGYAFEE